MKLKDFKREWQAKAFVKERNGVRMARLVYRDESIFVECPEWLRTGDTVDVSYLWEQKEEP